MFYLIPPAGFPITSGDILKIMIARLHPTASLNDFSTIIKKHARVKYCFFVNSGRCAQTLILTALKALSKTDKNEVIIPAYTCYSVPASVARAGLKIRIVDIDPHTLDYNYALLKDIDFTKVLAVNASNLFGLVSNWTELRVIAQKHRLYLIDDAAQTLGSFYNREPSGKMGDAGFYSLDRGKNLTTFSGGILMTDNDSLEKQLSIEHDCLKMPGLLFEAGVMTKIIIYGLMLRPRLYWLPQALPFLGLGQTVYDENFPMTRLSRIQLCAGKVLYRKVAAYNEIRTENARRLAEALSRNGRFYIPGYTTDNCPTYLRLPILAENKTARNLAVKELRKNKISTSVMYPGIIRNIPGLDSRLSSAEKNFPGASSVVDRLFTLPVHPYVTKRDIDIMISCLNV